MEAAKRFFHKHTKIHAFLFSITIFPLRQLIFWVKALLRLVGINKKPPYYKLKQYKNIHKGKRCFIVGTGPSLRMEDLEAIKGELSFSVNSIVLSFGDTTWRPDYYAIQDSFGYEKLKTAIKTANMPVVFNGRSDKTMTPKMNGIDYIPFPLNLLDHGKPGVHHLNRFSRNAYAVVYAGHSITYSCIELAVYMGFSEIVLLGVDCDYSKSVNHVKAYSTQNDKNAAFLMMKSYVKAKKFADRHKIRILNATRNGKMDIFEKVALEEYLK